ncbi:MAG: hypothetical protein NVSMB2_16540 [Chloroflexota bacterium]
MSGFDLGDTAVFEVRDALAEPGCAICSLALRSVGRFIQATAYDRATDVELRAQLRSARGFCNAHAYRWLREARNVLGTAQIYRDVVNAATADLSRPARRNLMQRLTSSAAAIRSVGPCLACDAQHEAEDRYIGALSVLLGEGAVAASAFEASDGLCLRHTEQAGRRGDAALVVVAGQTRRRAERLLSTLAEVIRKEDYRFRGEERTPDERRATADAVAWTIGAEGLVD